MSVDFYIATGTEFHQTGLNMANTNAAELLAWLDYVPQLWDGRQVSASDMAARCRRRLWDVARNNDPELPAREDGRVMFCGRHAGYLRDRVTELLAVCERALNLADDAKISWG